MNEKRYDQLVEIITPLAEAAGLSLWGVEIALAGKRTVVRIFLDKDGGVTVGECAKVSRQVGLALEVEDVIFGAYTLEVSSPGLDRKFFSPTQMEAYVGREVDVRLHDPMDGTRHFKGVLESVDGPIFILNTGSESVRIDFDQVKTARLTFEPPKKGK